MWQVDREYSSLALVLAQALEQASNGKGSERHDHLGLPFEQQLICILERYGLSFNEGQAVKKIIEAHYTGSEADKLGAINYIVANILVCRERETNK